MTAFKPKWRDWEAKTLPLQTDKADKDPFAGFAGSLPKRIQQNITEKRENSGNTLYQQASKTSKSPKSVVSVKSVSTGTEADWDAETAGIIEWFKATSPPSEPFELFPHVQVIHPGRWWQTLKADIAAGPRGPRARYGALQEDLKRLAEILDGPRPDTANVIPGPGSARKPGAA